MSARIDTLLWLAQRVSAALLAIVVMVHLATVVYAVRGGLTAAEIVERLQGHIGWLVFYVLFVAAAAVHAPLGLRTIIAEMTPLHGWLLNMLAALFALGLLIFGCRAVFSLFAFGVS
ncbi:MAG: succinate dehydrogenase [Acidiferrobacterales bacterium]